jgi:hypothetical protein
MKQFDDFVSSLSDEDVIEISTTANNMVNSLSQNASNFLGNQIAVISYCFSIELLRKYHAWLYE